MFSLCDPKTDCVLSILVQLCWETTWPKRQLPEEAARGNWNQDVHPWPRLYEG